VQLIFFFKFRGQALVLSYSLGAIGWMHRNVWLTFLAPRNKDASQGSSVTSCVFKKKALNFIDLNRIFGGQPTGMCQ